MDKYMDDPVVQVVQFLRRGEEAGKEYRVDQLEMGGNIDQAVFLDEIYIALRVRFSHTGKIEGDQRGKSKIQQVSRQPVMLGESQEMPALHFSQRVADDLFESVHHPTDVQIAVPTEGGSLQAGIFPVFAPGNTAGKLVLLDISHIVCDVVYGWDRCGINSILHEMNAPCPVSQVYFFKTDREGRTPPDQSWRQTDALLSALCLLYQIRYNKDSL